VSMPRPQFTLRVLLMAMLVVAAFFGGIHFERERRRREEARAAEQTDLGIICVIPPGRADTVMGRPQFSLKTLLWSMVLTTLAALSLLRVNNGAYPLLFSPEF
jgi:hypothetical protein